MPPGGALSGALIVERPDERRRARADQGRPVRSAATQTARRRRAGAARQIAGWSVGWSFTLGHRRAGAGWTRSRRPGRAWDGPAVFADRPRVDESLWRARFLKARWLATEAVLGGRVQVGARA